MSFSYTSSNTNTYTDSRARYVMGKVLDDFINMHNRGFEGLKWKKLKKWIEDLTFVASKKALEKFEIQFIASSGQRKWAIIYHLIADGSIQIDDESGQIDYYAIPEDANIKLVISRDPNNDQVSKYLEERGWTSGASFLELYETRQGSYSKNGYGLKRNIKGDWS